MKTFLKSPLLHFLVLGVAGFFVYEQFKPAGRETIFITTQTIDALLQQSESIAQNPYTAEQRRELIESHIEDEVLLREAYSRGFDKNDYRVRKRLLNVMRATLSDVIPEPSLAQLRAYFDENKERYQTPPSVSFEYVFFAFNSDNLPADPQEFIRRLDDSQEPHKEGDFSDLGSRFTKNSFRMIAGTFGKPFAETVFALDPNKWSGPFESFRGVHYVRLTAHHEPETSLFEEVESYLRQEYLLRKMRDSQQRKIDDMRKNYTIVVEGSKTEK